MRYPQCVGVTGVGGYPTAGRFRQQEHIEQVREVSRSIADRIPVRHGEDGVSVAELSLNYKIPLAQVVGVDFDIGVVAGRDYRPDY